MRLKRLTLDQARERFQLTEREQAVVEHLTKGWTNKEIAAALEITEQSVKKHIKHILEKTGSTSRDLTRAIELNPNDASAFMSRGWAKGLTGNYRGEIKDHTRAIQLNPKYAEAYGSRGVAKYLSGDFTGAIEDSTVALSLDPQMGIGYYYRGLAYMALKKTAEAREDLKRAQALMPQFSDEIGKFLQD